MLLLLGALLVIAPPVWLVFFATSVDGTAFDLSVLAIGLVGTIGTLLIVVGALMVANVDSPLNPVALRRRRTERQQR